MDPKSKCWINFCHLSNHKCTCYMDFLWQNESWIYMLYLYFEISLFKKHFSTEQVTLFKRQWLLENSDGSLPYDY